MIGQTLAGRYHIIRYLARGGFGTTFVAVDRLRPGNPECLVKQFQPTETDPQTLQAARRLFDREAETLERLGNHDQIPRLLAHFEESQQFFLVQELIVGQDLTAEVNAYKRWREEEAIDLLEEVLEVLVFVHQQGVIHRDIKPDNLIRRAADGKIVLIDFGAVKQIRTVHVLRLQGATIIGTTGYMPAEQNNGHPQFASDVYAVGMLAIQALTGIFPHELPTDAQTGEAIWRSRARVGDRTAQVLDKMISYDYRQRYRSATEALAAVRELKSAIASTTISPQPAPRSSWTKSQIIATIALFVGIVSGIATVIKVPEWLGGDGPPPIAPHTPDPEEERWKTYQHDNYRFRMQYPQDWAREDVEDPFTATVVIFVNYDRGDGVYPRAIVQVEELKKAMSLAEYSQSSVAEIKQFLKQAEISGPMKTTLGNRPAYKLVYRGMDGDKSLQKMEVGMVKNDWVYVITYEAASSDYSQFEQTAQEIIDSFELLGY